MTSFETRSRENSSLLIMILHKFLAVAATPWCRDSEINYQALPCLPPHLAPLAPHSVFLETQLFVAINPSSLVICFGGFFVERIQRA